MTILEKIIKLIKKRNKYILLHYIISKSNDLDTLVTRITLEVDQIMKRLPKHLHWSPISNTVIRKISLRRLVKTEIFTSISKEMTIQRIINSIIVLDKIFPKAANRTIIELVKKTVKVNTTTNNNLARGLVLLCIFL